MPAADARDGPQPLCQLPEEGGAGGDLDQPPPSDRSDPSDLCNPHALPEDQSTEDTALVHVGEWAGEEGGMGWEGGGRVKHGEDYNSVMNAHTRHLSGGSYSCLQTRLPCFWSTKNQKK